MLAFTLLRYLLPRAERDEIVADVEREFAARARSDGDPAARRWLWRQVAASTPPLVRWTWWRNWTGFIPTANAYRPGVPVFKYALSDLKYAARRLRSRPTYSVLAVLTLALGIGGTAAIFGIARPVLFDRLPYAHEKDVVSFWMGGSWTEEEFVHLRGRIPGYQSVAAYRHIGVTVARRDEAPRLVGSLETSTELFDVLGATPALGHNFEPGADAAGAEPVAIISNGLWRELGADSSVIGSRLTIGGAERTVIGVMPREFWFPTPDVRVWVPRTLNPAGRNGSYVLVGQVAPGENPAHMESRVTQLVGMLKERFTYSADWDKTKAAHVTPIREDLLGPMQSAVIATFVAMGLILLIACTNVAALMLGQVEGRATELAVRAALGANRRRLTQPLVIEALLIGVLAATFGAAIAATGFRTLAHALPLGAWADIAAFDWTLFVAALGLAIVAVLLVTLVPAGSMFRNDIRGDIHRALTRSRTGGVHIGGVRAERALVVVEVALAMLIASGATLVVRSVAKLYAIDPGFTTTGIAVIDAASAGTVPAAERAAAVAAMTRDLAQLPGVRSTAAAMRIPLRGNSNSFGITVEGRENAERSSTFFRVVSPGYFDTMGIALRSGRVFDASTVRRDGEMDVVINEALAAKYFPGEDPLGRRVGDGFGIPQRIIGVVANVAEGNLTDPAKPARYYSYTQTGWLGTDVTLLLQTTSRASDAALLDAARRTINTTAPAFAVRQTTTVEHVFDEAVGPARQVMVLLALLSALALILGAVGIYGVIAHFVSRRTRDWAIRVALGLPGSRVITHVLGQGAALVAIGVVIGGLGTLLLSKLLTAFLYNVSRADPAAFALAGGALFLTGLIAAFVPAHRASTVDPALVLRENA